MSTATKILIVILAFAIPLLLFWFLFFSPRLGELNSLSKTIPKLKQEIALLKAKERDLPKMEAELKIMEEILSQAVKLLPEKKDIPSVLTDISSLGNAAHLEFVSFEPQPEQNRDFYVAIPVKILIKGPFHNTVSFFDELSRMGRIVHVKEFSMGKAEEGSQVWSQSGTGVEGGGQQASPGGAAIPPAAGGSNRSTSPTSPASDETVRGGTWVITTDCIVETYRFLTENEQQKLRAKKAEKQNKKNRR